MSFEEFVENLIYSAAVSITVPNREAPAALSWAADRLRSRYGDTELALLRAQRAFEYDLAKLRESLAVAFSRLRSA